MVGSTGDEFIDRHIENERRISFGVNQNYTHSKKDKEKKPRNTYDFDVRADCSAFFAFIDNNTPILFSGESEARQYNNNLQMAGYLLADEFEDVPERLQEKAKRVKRFRQKAFHNGDYLIKRTIPREQNGYHNTKWKKQLYRWLLANEISAQAKDFYDSLPEEVAPGISRAFCDGVIISDEYRPSSSCPQEPVDPSTDDWFKREKERCYSCAFVK